MRFTQITLPARQPHAVAESYARLLAVPIAFDGDAAMVAIGWSRLRFVRDDEFASSHHLAITIPDTVFDDARTWMRERTPLLADVNGSNLFEAAPSWNARNFYFAGPEDSVLELIARRDRVDPADWPFDSHHLRGVSEVGIAVGQPIGESAAALSHQGLAVYGDPASADFGAVGDVDGLLILAASGRAWFPTKDRLVGIEATEIVATGGRPGRYALSSRAVLDLQG